MIADHPEWLRARSLGLKDKDAHHVMLASQGECMVLLTMDGGPRSRAEMIEQQFGLQVMSSPELCDAMGWQYRSTQGGADAQAC